MKQMTKVTHAEFDRVFGRLKFSAPTSIQPNHIEFGDGACAMKYTSNPQGGDREVSYYVANDKI